MKALDLQGPTSARRGLSPGCLDLTGIMRDEETDPEDLVGDKVRGLWKGVLLPPEERFERGLGHPYSKK